MRVEDALHEIVRTTHAMFGVDGASLMLTDAEQHLRSVAASDARLQHLEELQIEHAEGPCIAAFEERAAAYWRKPSARRPDSCGRLRC